MTTNQPTKGLSSSSATNIATHNGRLLDVEIGFDIGWDLAAYGLKMPEFANDALKAGYSEARVRRTTKLLKQDRYIRKWMQLRVNAWLRHRFVAETVTATYIRFIDVPTCAVTGGALTHATGLDTDWSVDRINNDGAYTPGNLVILSTKANKIKGRKTFHDVCEHAAGRGEDTALLSQLEWARMVALMLVPCNIENLALPMLPYPIAPPPGVPLSFPQSLQWALVSQRYGGPKAVLGKIKDACETPARKLKFHQLAQKVRRKADKIGGSPVVWLAPTLWANVLEFIQSMQASERKRIGALLGFLSGSGAEEWLSSLQLDNRGYVPGYNPPTAQFIAAGIDLGVDTAAGDEMDSFFEAADQDFDEDAAEAEAG